MKLYVLFDVVGWSTPIEGRTDGRRQYHVGRRGEQIDVPGDEGERLLSIEGAVSRSASDLEGAVAASTEPPSWSDDQLDSANVDDTVAYLAQHPSEASRVLTAETTRDERSLKVRKGVVEAAERVQAAYEEQVTADAEQRAADEDAEQRAYAATAGAGVAAGAPRIP